MVLEVISNGGVGDLALYACGFEDGWIADSRELEDLRRFESATGDDDLAGRFDGVFLVIVGEVDSDCFVAFEDDLVD